MATKTFLHILPHDVAAYLHLVSYNVSAVATPMSCIGVHSILLESVQDSFLFLLCTLTWCLHSAIRCGVLQGLLFQEPTQGLRCCTPLRDCFVLRCVVHPPAARRSQGRIFFNSLTSLDTSKRSAVVIT